MKTEKANQIETYYYIALVLRGSEKQYLDLMGHLSNQDSAKIVYQRKALTYLRIVSDDRKPSANAKEYESEGVIQ